MIKRILIGYDGTERGDDALALGRAFARAAGAQPHVVVATVHEALMPKDSHGTPLPREERLREEAAQQLDRARLAWPELPESAFVTLRANSPSAGLQRLAADDFDVIVLGASHRSALGRIWAGSVTEQTLQGAPRPVAVAPPGYAAAHRDPAPFARIGIGYDGTAEARHALELAAPLASDANAEVVLIDAVHAGASLTQAYGYGEILETLHGHAEAQLADGRAELLEHGVERVETERPLGVPSQVLVAASERLDLLVLGSRGHGPALRVLLGSSSARVVRAAACPVLVYPRSAVADDDAVAAAAPAEADTTAAAQAVTDDDAVAAAPASAEGT